MTIDCQSRADKHRKEARPPGCILCGGGTWWDGTRPVFNVRKSDGGFDAGVEEVRRRARCQRPDCPRRSFTIYDEDAYPHRGFRLGVVASAVAAVIGGELRYEVAAKHECCGDSVRRWLRWTESLIGDVKELARTCTKLGGDGMPGAEPIQQVPIAAGVMHLGDRLAQVFASRGVELPEPQAPGIVRLLIYLLRRSGEVFWLTKSSPPLRAKLEAICV
jgi:hypothetical protein